MPVFLLGQIVDKKDVVVVPSIMEITHKKGEKKSL